MRTPQGGKGKREKRKEKVGGVKERKEEGPIRPQGWELGGTKFNRLLRECFLCFYLFIFEIPSFTAFRPVLVGLSSHSVLAGFLFCYTLGALRNWGLMLAMM